ncbi:hypothetical protein Tcan_09247 [Toxocara canis]|uniref:Uncharacterized protein n=1 Tax=Toxocara canis TaxID=6265 RepID=A0A0B2VLJ9_TOXCA|nr:hypothetical protein Tcan_09247 [Toxocara canis]
MPDLKTCSFCFETKADTKYLSQKCGSVGVDVFLYYFIRLLLNGLTLGHFFTIVEDEGQLGVLTDKGKCECCVASISKGLLGLPHGNSLKKAASAGIMQETSFSNDGRRVHSQSDLLNSKSPSRPDALPMKTIRTQPLPADHFNAISKGPSTNKPKKKREAEEEERNCCKQCCADWGQCCIGLMSGI